MKKKQYVSIQLKWIYEKSIQPFMVQYHGQEEELER